MVLQGQEVTQEVVQEREEAWKVVKGMESGEQL